MKELNTNSSEIPEPLFDVLGLVRDLRIWFNAEKQEGPSKTDRVRFKDFEPKDYRSESDRRGTNKSKADCRSKRGDCSSSSDRVR